MAFNFEKCRDYLVCPKCRAELVLDGDTLVCTDPAIRLRYPILDGIPRLLVEEATEISVEDWTAIMKKNGRTCG